mmetsp:Transcript_41412/g.101641  ORF Transcript_41412/g.101641 Transcript_41412/m.101641 type:complete len:351 (-) Transcript_41412:1181-2233(-)
MLEKKDSTEHVTQPMSTPRPTANQDLLTLRWCPPPGGAAPFTQTHTLRKALVRTLQHEAGLRRAALLADRVPVHVVPAARVERIAFEPVRGVVAPSPRAPLALAAVGAPYPLVPLLADDGEVPALVLGEGWLEVAARARALADELARRQQAHGARVVVRVHRHHRAHRRLRLLVRVHHRALNSLDDAARLSGRLRDDVRLLGVGHAALHREAVRQRTAAPAQAALVLLSHSRRELSHLGLHLGVLDELQVLRVADAAPGRAPVHAVLLPITVPLAPDGLAAHRLAVLLLAAAREEEVGGRRGLPEALLVQHVALLPGREHVGERPVAPHGHVELTLLLVVLLREHKSVLR